MSRKGTRLIWGVLTIGDLSLRVGDGYDGMFVESGLEVVDFFERGFELFSLHAFELFRRSATLGNALLCTWLKKCKAK